MLGIRSKITHKICDDPDEVAYMQLINHVAIDIRINVDRLTSSHIHNFRLSTRMQVIETLRELTNIQEYVGEL